MTEIVRALPESWAQVREIRLRALTSDPRAFGQTWEDESGYSEDVWRERVTEAAWFIALDDGDLPTGVIASRHEADSPENERELQAMWVTPDKRGSGLAHKLIEAVLEWAAQDGADTVTLFVGPDSARARTIYESIGFEDTGDRWEHGDENDEPWVKMARRL